MDEQPTIFHVTHWKAGSQWIHKILREITLSRIVSPQLNERQFLGSPLVQGAVYPTVYVTREQFYSIALPSNYFKFVVLRDLRDTLVSAYFSIRYSHAVISTSLATWRERLANLSVENGLLMLMDEWLPACAKIQTSWINSGEDFIRYEDLLINDLEILENILINKCRIPVPVSTLREIILANRFKKLTGGREPGNEDVMAHERKGISGDWRNYFSSKVSTEFSKRFVLAL